MYQEFSRTDFEKQIIKLPHPEVAPSATVVTLLRNTMLASTPYSTPPTVEQNPPSLQGLGVRMPASEMGTCGGSSVEAATVRYGSVGVPTAVS